MQRAEILAIAVHHAWYACSHALGENPVSWVDIPSWRRDALEHTIGFWESWTMYRDLDYPTFLAATQLTWIQFHRRHRWTHAELTPYVSLPLEQQKKLLVMLKTYLLFREFTA
jgi:hypothetical protein